MKMFSTGEQIQVFKETNNEAIKQIIKQVKQRI